MDIKELLIKDLPIEIKEHQELIVKCSDSKKGDYTIPCFSLAKEFHKAPNLIAEELADKLQQTNIIENVEAVNGYLNIFLNREVVSKNIVDNFVRKGQKIFCSEEGKGKTICIDFSSANLAKYLHIGHLSTTILGECIARLFENAGYKVVRINFVGDYGTPFGKIIAAYQLWGNEDDIKTRGVDAIQDLYIEFCKHEGEEEFDNLARDTFKKLEQKDPKITELYNKLIAICLESNKQETEALGVKFDDFNGERYYNDMVDDFVKQLDQKGFLQEGEGGSKIVDLGNLGIVLIKKSDGTSLYATRDLPAVVDRYQKYHFYKNYYVTDVAQKLHFEQVFKILQKMGYDYANDCKHIYYGRIRLPEGKISSRLGKQALIRDIISEATSKAREVIKDRNLPNAEQVAKVVGLGATVFTVTKNEKIKDTVFDLNEALRFDGETSPYMQYTYARLSSILRKADIKDGKFDAKYLTGDDAYEVVKIVAGFKDALNQAIERIEPNVINKYTMELCKAVNKFYTTERVLTDNATETFSKCQLIKIARDTIKFALNLLCIDTVEIM